MILKKIIPFFPLDIIICALSHYEIIFKMFLKTFRLFLFFSALNNDVMIFTYLYVFVLSLLFPVTLK